MKKILLFILIAVFYQGKSQISITTTNMPVSGDTARLSIAATSNLNNPNVTNYKLTGANFVWNFDSLKAINQVMRNFEPALNYSYFSTGYCEKTADTMDLFIIQFTNICDIYKKNSSAFYKDAWGITMLGIPIPNSYTDKDELYNFPLNYQDRDSTTFFVSTITNSLIPFGFKKHGYRITQADGWGTIKTPFGTEPCLRVVTTNYEIDSIRAMIPLGTFTLPLNFGYKAYTRSYQWLTKNEHVPYLEVSGSLFGNTFTPNLVRFRDTIKYFVGVNEIESDQLALAIYPNPATNELNFLIPARGVNDIQIFDLQGRLILTQKFDNENSINKNSIDISSLQAGIYAGKINNGKAVQNFKFIKE